MFVLSFSQNKDSLNIENKRYDYKYKKLYVPVGLMIAGAALDGNGSKSIKNQIKDYRNSHYPDFKYHIDDYAQYAPFVALYGFEWLGMTPRTDWKNRTAIAIKGELLTLALVYTLKITLNEKRPDRSAYSFPSGHTADAFAGATILAMEYGENYKWVPYASYSVATGVGVMRMANNKHYISDVLFGAGLGILSMKVAYWTHQYKWNKPQSETDPFAGNIY